MSFFEHLEELRNRLVVAAAAVGVGFLVGVAYAKEIFSWLLKPLLAGLPPQSPLIFTGVMEGFMTYLKVAFFFGVFVASPVVLYEMWAFVAPGLHRHEKRLALPFILGSLFCFLGGGAFGYYVVFPMVFKYLIGEFSTGLIRAMPSISEYLSFSMTLLVIFGAVFELPPVLLLLAWIGVVDGAMLARYRRHAIVAIFAASAVLTPTTDALTMTLMAVPLCLLYELSIWLVRLAGRRGRAGGEGAEAA